MDKPAIRVISNLPRSGGTLLARCVGSMDGITLLSEIHPLGCQIYNPLNQACEWHGLLAKKELIGSQYRFLDAIQLIFERSQKNESDVVIRDWAHLDFIGYPFLDSPSYHSALVEALSKRFRVLEVSLTRHPVDLWMSLEKLPIMRNLPVEVYLEGYRKYAEKCITGYFLKYEDFTRRPEDRLQWLCEILQLPFDKQFSRKWANYDKITGAVLGKARGSGLNKIKPLPHHELPDKLYNSFALNPDYQRSLELLNYQHCLTTEK